MCPLLNKKHFIFGAPFQYSVCFLVVMYFNATSLHTRFFFGEKRRILLVMQMIPCIFLLCPPLLFFQLSLILLTPPPLPTRVVSQVEEELLEQEFLERCFQEMLEEEDQDWFIPSRDLNNQGVGQLQQQLNGLSVSDHHNNLEEVAVSQRLHLISQHREF
uniref:Ataxin-2 C-terminal domain-containing protein n=1 Tax=Gasterosteus aculeatus aculeatus TaxID=481459 RepID=A0AAQ4QJ98_GASAC